jgi:hypothetical protein
MKKSKIVAIALAIAIALSPMQSFAGSPPPVPGHVMGSATPWWIFICPTGIVSAAMVKNWRRHHELTTQEAWTCGFLYWWNEGTGHYGP